LKEAFVMKQRRLRAPSPALVISLIALFVALGGTTAYASGLISGRQIVNHSIPAKKLTAAAVSALQGPRGPVGPGARSFQVPAFTPDSVVHRLTTTHGIDVSYKCDSNSKQVHFFLKSHLGKHTALVSGHYAQDGMLKSIHPLLNNTATEHGFGGSTLNLDVIAWTGRGDGMVSRIDLGGYNNGSLCQIWGLITPGT
jgi:hypothetical protein